MTTFKESDIALVTGHKSLHSHIIDSAGSGIGRETCRLLAEQGATVVATDLNERTAEETVRSLKGKNHMSLKLDVTKKSEVESVMRKIKAKYSSPPNIALNSAGLILWESLLDLTEETYNKLLDVNLKGTVWVTQAVCRELTAAKKSGSIINIASIAKGGAKDLSLYAATKGAVESFSNSVASEYGPHGIRTNVVSPGATDTPLMKPCPENDVKGYKMINPLGRFGQPREIAEVIVFLASEKASYVNGTTFAVNGGLR